VSQEQPKDIWCLLEEASSHLRQQPPPEGRWEHPEDVENVRRLLRDHPDQVQETGGEGETTLHQAVRLRLPDIAEVLLQLGADPNGCPPETGWTPLHEAVRRSYDEDRDMHLIRALLDHGADPNRPDTNGETPLDLAWGRAADVLRAQGGQLNLNTACRLGLVEQVKQMLEADPAAIENAPEPRRLLSDAVGCCYMATKESEALEIISLLLRHGANVNAADADRGTPLYYACGGGAPVSVIRLLLLHGADVHAPTTTGIPRSMSPGHATGTTLWRCCSKPGHENGTVEGGLDLGGGVMP
jgi:ankyrin repeat protein